MYPSHDEVSGRSHRDELTARINASLHAYGKDAGKTRGEALTQMSGIKIDLAAVLHLAKNGAGHHIARCQLLPRMDFGHEALSLGVQQACSFASHGLGNQGHLGVTCSQRGGVKLHELHVQQMGSGPERHSLSVTGGYIRIGRVAIQLTASARGENGGPGETPPRCTFFGQQYRSGTAAVADQ